MKNHQRHTISRYNGEEFDCPGTNFPLTSSHREHFKYWCFGMSLVSDTNIEGNLLCLYNVIFIVSHIRLCFMGLSSRALWNWKWNLKRQTNLFMHLLAGVHRVATANHLLTGRPSSAQWSMEIHVVDLEWTLHTSCTSRRIHFYRRSLAFAFPVTGKPWVWGFYPKKHWHVDRRRLGIKFSAISLRARSFKPQQPRFSFKITVLYCA